MSGQIMLDTATSDAIQEAAGALRTKVHELIGPRGPKDHADLVNFEASVGVQAVIRSHFAAENSEDLNKAILIGAGDGLGMLLGMIPDPAIRMAMFQYCVQAMHNGSQMQAKIHTPEGEA